MKAEEYLLLLKERCLEAGHLEIAEQQMKYMRNQFAFYGIKAPVLVPIHKALFKEYGVLEGKELERLVELCMEDEYREVHYFAVEMVQKVQKKQSADFINVFEFLIINQSWWDTVDWIAKLVGIHFKKYPELILPTTRRWMDSGNIWLQRVSIIFQLFYREQTDEALLYAYILEVADSKEFFLQKAAGWALRQYSKYHADSVMEFIKKHEGDLAALTKREGLRLLKKKK